MSDSSFLEYLFETHKSQLVKPADYFALLCHSMLLDRKAKLKSGRAVLPDDWNQSDPIRLCYVLEDGSEINVSVVETAADVFISVTESKSDLLGHLEAAADDHVELGRDLPLERAFRQLGELRKRFEDEIWAVVMPSRENERDKKETGPSRRTHETPVGQAGYQEARWRPHNPLMDPRFIGRGGGLGVGRDPYDYGRSDLDPFGLLPAGGLHGPGMGVGGGGGMIFDPRRNLIDDRPLYPGAPPGAAPPGARIDPIEPFPTGGVRPPGAARPRPDPDMPAPPGWEDMYL